MSEQNRLRALLIRDGVVRSPEAVLTPLPGGVSSAIFRVDDENRTFVVKQALEQLRVAQPWFADVSRNQFERAFLEYVAQVRPDAVPRVFESAPEAGYFSMEYLEGFATWKDDLLRGHFDRRLARSAGALLGEIHAHSWNDPTAERLFASTDNFDQLRIDPYLRATARVHADLAAPILEESKRLRATHRCLVHGDFSPKNLLHRDGRLVVVDCEVAWYGDPAFDLAFFLNHFYLKSLYHHPHSDSLIELAEAAAAAYQAANPHAGAMTADAARLLPMLMLARVDGKSPVEYLTREEQRTAVREFAGAQIARQTPQPLNELARAWSRFLSRFFGVADDG